MALELLVGPPPKIDKIATGFCYTEGPVFSRIGYLLFSDVRAEPNHAMGRGYGEPFRENSNGANGLDIRSSGPVAHVRAGPCHANGKGWKITVLASAIRRQAADQSQRSGVCHRWQHLFQRDPIAERFTKYAGVDSAVVYQITRKGQLRVATRDCTRPNGVALSPRISRRLFVADTDQRNVRVFEVNGDGSPEKRPSLCELKGDQRQADRTD